MRSTKVITFNSTGPWHTIDGKLFDDTVGQVVRLDAAEEWKIENSSTTRIDHPFHIHINPFQVVEVFDPNEPLVHPTTGEPLLDPETASDPNQRIPFPKYVFDQTPREIEGATQCELKVDDPLTWKPCTKDKKSSRIWRDVFPIPAGRDPGTGKVVPGYFKMRSRFVDYSGWFVIHCHILAHEDRGMMTIVHVAPFAPPVAHH
jgi:FtsP/CotA-like multicopper oxidase with cupredoxin domain